VASARVKKSHFASQWRAAGMFAYRGALFLCCALMQDLSARLEIFLRPQIGAPVRVADLAPMEDGHAGLTFGFRLIDAEQEIGRYVLRMAPVGVTRRGNTDVYRQAPLLRALHKAGLPVPAVPFACAEEEPLGAPFIVMERLPGRVFLIWEPDGSFKRDTPTLTSVWTQAAQALASIHRVKWQTTLAEWEQPQPLGEALRRWDKVLRHAQAPEWLELGLQLQEKLMASEPLPSVIGLVHGDFQPGNVLYDKAGDKLTGVVDWELSSIGAQGLDVGWLMMMGDPSAWSPSWPPIVALKPKQLLEAYVAAGGPAAEHVAWFQAFAAYRMASIACLNVKLHRTGKRPDPLWDRFAPSVSVMFRWGIDRLTN
jgi:aminoglycoside phosphotransferase (APT) family kinase protein